MKGDEYSSLYFLSTMSRFGRNEKCWCGSGKKYKKCHMGDMEDQRYAVLVRTMGPFGARNQIRSEAGTIDIAKEFRIAQKVIEEKTSGNRQKPSSSLTLSNADIPEKMIRLVLDVVAYTCDQMLPEGRSTACVYSAIFLRDILKNLLELDAHAIVGTATYSQGGSTFSWEHAWVEYSEQIVDGNVDSMSENPKVDDCIRPKNYWGLKQQLPADRTFEQAQIIDDDWIKQNMEYDTIVQISSGLVEMLRGSLGNKAFVIKSADI